MATRKGVVNGFLLNHSLAEAQQFERDLIGDIIQSLNMASVLQNEVLKQPDHPDEALRCLDVNFRLLQMVTLCTSEAR